MFFPPRWMACLFAAVLLLVLAAIFAAGACVGKAFGATAQPGVVVLCASGIVTPLEEHFGGTLASGSDCVLHDRAGKATSAGFVEVFDTTRDGP